MLLQHPPVSSLNTQTHILLASAFFIPAAPVLAPAWSNKKFRVAAIAAFVGAMLPDASLFLMVAIAKAQGVSNPVIFSEWYYSEFWQNLGAMTNSIPVYAAMAFIAYGLQTSDEQYLLKQRRLLGVCLIIGLAALIHTLTDLPLHYDDGHPHFWPFSNWVFASPISYWDPAHFGRQWALVELVFAVFLIVFLWRHYANQLARTGLVLAGFSYAVMTTYWFDAFN